MSWIELFFTAFVISLLGSIPIGMITLAITERSITKGFKAGFILSLGATIMEFVYTYLAISCLDALTENISLGRNINWASLLIFLIIGTFYLIKKAQPPKSTFKHHENHFKEFLTGIGVGAINFLIIPYWLFMGVWLKSNNFEVLGTSSITVFAIGAALGALVVFVSYGKLASYISGKLNTIARYTNKVVGIIFIILAAFQAYQLL